MGSDFNTMLSALDGLHYGLAGLVGVLLMLLLWKTGPIKKTSDTLLLPEMVSDERDAEAEKQSAPVVPGVQFATLSPDSALQLLALLQQEARLIDFLQEDAQSFSDAEVGAAARVVHGGARKVLRENFVIDAIRAESEGSSVTLLPGFNNHEMRLSGNVVGEPPFKGHLLHRGWRVTSITLPKVSAGHDLTIIAPAELEL
jgi:hypothetical protein